MSGRSGELETREWLYIRCVAIPRRLFALLTVASVAMLAGCARGESGSPRRVATLAESIDQPGSAPTRSYAVGSRSLALERADRPLPTMVWYPAAGAPGGAVSRDAVAAIGRLPIVLLSHGLGGQPEGFTHIAEGLASDGFVVVAPAYPYTKKGSTAFDRNDVRNQPADAIFVLDEVAKLGRRMDDPFGGRLASSRMCVAGFSAGGTTTTGMFTQSRDRRLRCAVIISAAAMEGGFTGQAAPVLFLHGDADTVVSYSRGRSAYEKLAWPKAFMTMKGQGHGEFLDSKRDGFRPARAAITDFLRWNLYGDTAARQRIPAAGTLTHVAAFEDRL
jgi:predicted dienelactone hydrolase